MASLSESIRAHRLLLLGLLPLLLVLEGDRHVVSNCLFEGNVAQADGAGVTLVPSALAFVTNNVFVHNASPQGAGVHVLSGGQDDALIQDNIAAFNDGFGFFTDGSPTLRSSPTSRPRSRGSTSTTAAGRVPTCRAPSSVCSWSPAARPRAHLGSRNPPRRSHLPRSR